MSIELYETALTELTNIKTDLYSLYFEAFGFPDNTNQQTPVQKRRTASKQQSKTNSSMQVESSTKDPIVISDDESDSPGKQDDVDLVILINPVHSKVMETSSSSDDESEAESIAESSSPELVVSRPVKTKSHSDSKVKSTPASKPKKLLGAQSNPIRKMDVRITRSSDLKNKDSKGNKRQLRSKKK